MVYALNVFRVLGDICHASSKIILIWAIHWNKSAEGVSLITQLFYLAVFVTRYLDLFWTPPFKDFIFLWNFCGKILYITTSAYIVFLMLRVFARTREKEKAWRFAAYIAAGSLLATMPATLIFEGKSRFSFLENTWVFSIILESFCILPQLLLLRQTAVPTVIDSYYLVTLGSYRALYILNWIYRLATERHFDPIAFVFGVIQTAFYIDFAWVYYGRQRVKLRAGAIVDEDDYRKGWLVGRLLGKNKHLDGEIDEEQGNGPRKPHRWGARGISVQADDGTREVDAEQPLTDPRAFEDESDEEDIDAPPPAKAGHASPNGELSHAAEWRDEQSK